jgi:hypothetical protein
MKNTIIYWTILVISLVIIMSIKMKKVSTFSKILGFFVIYFLIFISIEVVDLFSGIPIWDQSERTANCYNWFVHYLKQNYDNGESIDYTESLFFGNYNEPVEKATHDKYEYMFKELNLAKGKKLLDCGCGIGTWMEFCKKKRR